MQQELSDSIRVFVVGDFCSRPSTSYISVSDELKKLVRGCDCSVVNFEVPLRPDGDFPPLKYKQRFFQNDDSPAFLRGLGFDLFSMANNHTFDWGDSGYYKTKSVLGDSAFGAGTYEDAARVKVVEAKGIKIGFLGVVFSAYTGVFDDVYSHVGLGCAYINDLRINHIIADAKKEVDYLIVLPHDGIEYIDIPLPETIARFRDFIDYGADAVIGAHPHCPQGWEEYKGKPIFYSLGNFFFNSKEDTLYRATNRPHWYEGLGVVLDISSKGVECEVINIVNTDNVLLSIDHRQERDSHNRYLVDLLANRNNYDSYLQRICQTMGYQKEMRVVDETFHPASLKYCTKLLINCWIKKLSKKSFVDDFKIMRLAKHDGRRSLWIRAMETTKNYSD